MTVHIEGMGVLGSLLAHRLAAKGRPFTWHDTDEPTTAWRASTGCVFPGRDPAERAAYQWWLRNVADAGGDLGTPVFNTKAVPGDGPGRAVPIGASGLNYGTAPSVHLNPQAFVQNARQAHGIMRFDRAPEGAFIVHAHGFHGALTHYLWGWSAVARLDLDIRYPAQPRAALMLREHRFRSAYAYPIPDKPDLWFIGSAMVRQTRPRSRPIPPELDTWQEVVTATTRGAVKLLDVLDLREGWRPCGIAGLRINAHEAWLPPMSHSGFRLGPVVLDELLNSPFFPQAEA